MRSKLSGLIAASAKLSTLLANADISRSSPATTACGSPAFKLARSSAAIASSGARSDSCSPSCRSKATRSVKSLTAPSSATTALRGASSARLRFISAIPSRIAVRSTPQRRSSRSRAELSNFAASPQTSSCGASCGGEAEVASSLLASFAELFGSGASLPVAPPFWPAKPSGGRFSALAPSEAFGACAQ